MTKITHRQHIPYNTGKVKIGSAYTSKVRQMNQDEHEIQDLLLSKPVKRTTLDAVALFLALSLYAGIAKVRKIALRGLK